MSNSLLTPNLLSHFERKIFPKMVDLAMMFWHPPHRIAQHIAKEISNTDFSSIVSHVLVSGETLNITVYFLTESEVLICTPLGQVNEIPIFQDSSLKIVNQYSKHICVVQKDAKLSERLNLPTIVLINPSAKDVFPAPRLALCVLCLASYIRKLQKAEVHILDMQLGLTVDSLIKNLNDIDPDIIGISISFGQMPLSRDILRKVFEFAGSRTTKAIVVAGNAISAFAHEGLLTEFPELIICMGEGEPSLSGIVDFYKGKISLDKVPGIAFVRNGILSRNARAETDLNTIALPAMDTTPDLLMNNGAMILESSRGCSHSACTFCPRNHKPTRWKGINPDILLHQLEYYHKILVRYNSEPRIFFVDEDFLGKDETGTDKRIREIMHGILNKGLGIQFEADTRVDQVFNFKKDKSWNINRMETISICKKAGLHRLLLGVESGSNSILKRFNKGISVEEAVRALRILTSLNVGLRITFITFDPLMTFSELKENLAFLGRQDIFLKPINIEQVDYSDLYDRIADPSYITEHSSGRPFYESVCYMLVNLEVLMTCEYSHMLTIWEKKHGRPIFQTVKPDYNMARHRVLYVDPLIGKIAHNCQKWIDRNFALDYCLKGMYKTAIVKQRDLLLNLRISYRRLSYHLLKSLVWLFDKGEGLDPNSLEGFSDDDISELLNLKNDLYRKNPDDLILATMELMHWKMREIVRSVNIMVSNGLLADTDGRLAYTINIWNSSRTWSLINP